MLLLRLRVFASIFLNATASKCPTTWDQVIDSRGEGLVRMPGFPADLFLNFMGMCVSRGSCVAGDDRLFDSESPRAASKICESWHRTCPTAIYDMNPIGLYEAMAASDEFRVLSIRLHLQQLLSARVRGQSTAVFKPGTAERRTLRCARYWAGPGSLCRPNARTRKRQSHSVCSLQGAIAKAISMECAADSRPAMPHGTIRC